jgi:pimeloyl-ACP methyl ester carboxylesterase
VLLESFRGFMDALKIPRASLVGNSMGAGLVIGMALTYPERVDRIVLIGGLPDHIREKVTSPMIRRALDRHPPTWLARLANRLLGRHFTKTVLNEMIYDPRLLTPAVVERSYRNRQRSNLIKPLLSLANNLSLWEEGFAKRLQELSGRPILIIWGEQDKVFPPSVARELQTTWPTAKLELVPDAGHIPMWEQPSLVNPLLLRFLQP